MTFAKVAKTTSSFTKTAKAGGGENRRALFGSAIFGSARFGQSSEGVQWSKTAKPTTTFSKVAKPS